MSEQRHLQISLPHFSQVPNNNGNPSTNTFQQNTNLPQPNSQEQTQDLQQQIPYDAKKANRQRIIQEMMETDDTTEDEQLMRQAYKRIQCNPLPPQ